MFLIQVSCVEGNWAHVYSSDKLELLRQTFRNTPVQSHGKTRIVSELANLLYCFLKPFFLNFFPAFIHAASAGEIV